MNTFSWQGRNARGQSVSGQIEAESADAVAGQLSNSDITPITIRKIRDSGSTSLSISRLFGREKLDDKDLIFFSRQMYTLSKAGVPLSQSLKGVSASSENAFLKRVTLALKDSIESGNELSAAMVRHGDGIFSTMYINLIRVGESSGKMETSFQLMADYLQRDREIRNNIKSALRYPAMVIIAMAVAVTILMVFVIPRFAEFFANFGAELPLPTKILIGTSNIFSNYWWAMILVLAASGFAFRRWTATQNGRYRWDRLKFRFPVIGNILFRGTMARFARAFAISYRAGVPLIQALTRVSQAIENEFVGQAIISMRSGIERGDSLLRVSEATGLFSPLVLQMIAIGEETGEIDSMLEETADFYETEVSNDVDNLSALIEPIMLVFMGGLVLIMALGVFLPMWEVGRAALG